MKNKKTIGLILFSFVPLISTFVFVWYAMFAFKRRNAKIGIFIQLVLLLFGASFLVAFLHVIIHTPRLIEIGTFTIYTVCNLRILQLLEKTSQDAEQVVNKGQGEAQGASPALPKRRVSPYDIAMIAAAIVCCVLTAGFVLLN